ncbi:DUF1707 SHOCT-like domain-containing protein [Blastococcus sp. SYSU DS1024]
MPEPHLRAADSDRAAVATTLGHAMSEGRLTVAEYDERLARVYAARTFGELAELTADLPAAPSRPAPAPVPAGTSSCPAGATRHGHAWGSWSSTALIVLAVWAVTSIAAREFLYFWPFWVIVPWGAVLLLGHLGERGRRRLPG